jgi:hypothetical protein
MRSPHHLGKAFVDRMVADACAGAQVDMDEYSAAWVAQHLRYSATRRKMLTS